jgi:hypothetical protein
MDRFMMDDAFWDVEDTPWHENNRMAMKIAVMERGRNVCFGSKGGKAPKPDPAIGEAALANAELGREALAFYRQAYNDSLPLANETARLENEIAQQQIRIADANELRAGEQWDHHRSTFLPIEKQVAADAMGYDSAEAQERAAAQAGIDVTRQYDIAEQAQQRAMQRMGVNPNSGRYVATSDRMALDKAVAGAGAQTMARQNLVDKGIALRAGAANFGRNMPNTAAQAYGVSVGAGNAATGALASGLAANQSSLGIMGQGYQTAMAGNQSAMNGLNQQYQNQVTAWNAKQQANASTWGGIGSLVGTGIGAYAALG